MENQELPDITWRATDIATGSYNETWIHQMNASYNGEEDYRGVTLGHHLWVVLNVGEDSGGGFYKFGGHDFDLWYAYPTEVDAEKLIVIRHNYGLTWYTPPFYTGHNMDFYNHAGTKETESVITYAFPPDDYGLSMATIEADYVASRLPYKVQCNHVYFFVDFGFNTTTYASLHEAWTDGGLWILFGINFDQMAQGYDSWSLVSRLLSFQPVDIPYPINTALGFGLWGCIIFLVVTFVLKVIPFLGGG
jgi:hypothetical protein